MWYEVGIQFNSFACGYPVVPAPFIENTIIPHWIVLVSMLKISRVAGYKINMPKSIVLMHLE